MLNREVCYLHFEKEEISITEKILIINISMRKIKKTDRRKFLKKAVSASAVGLAMPYITHYRQNILKDIIWGQKQIDNESGEILYNGIHLPKIWPPNNMDSTAYEPMPVPYLSSPPRVIPINVGRQLFVDDFLVESTNLKRVFHKAQKYEGNPVLKPETALEKGSEYNSWYANGPYLPAAVSKDGGVWWDPQDKVFKLWYEAGWLENIAYAISTDGIHWKRPSLDLQVGTNRILPDLIPNSNTVFLDHFAKNPNERFKMFLCQEMGNFFTSRYVRPNPGYSMVSSNGIYWSEPVPTGFLGDRSTIFFNPFRNKWIYSIRSGSANGRARLYREHSNFLEGAKWNDDDLVFWTSADYLDLPDPAIGDKAQLYNLSAVAYESIMLGLHGIHLGPTNEVCMKLGIPKTTELKLSYSRDGFHWHRPDREAFIPATRKQGSWDRGYVQSVGGICVIVGNMLWFYYSGFQGDEQRISSKVKFSGTYANGSTGIAILRRDGFASMSPYYKSGLLTTRLLSFTGKYVFVNVDCPKGSLKVEILDEKGTVIPPFTFSNCNPVSTDSTINRITWNKSADLSTLKVKEVRFRFYLENGHLYSFWVTSDESGASNGYVAAGGPGYTGAIDNRGLLAYKDAIR